MKGADSGADKRAAKRADKGGLAATLPATMPSTLDTGIQMALEQVLLDRLGSLPELVSITALVVDNASLAVLGYAGSADFGNNARAADVDMVRGVRSPGSTLKPFLYALALDDGLIHSERLLIDVPQNFGGFAPGNFESSFAGAVSVSDALQRSLNVPAVDLLDGTAPPTLPDPVMSTGLRETAWVDPATPRRLRPGCAPDASVHWEALEYARWPTLLEPWPDP